VYISRWSRAAIGHRSRLYVKPDEDPSCSGQPDGTGAAGATAADECRTAVRAQGDHLGVAAVPRNDGLD
jgi:hypothetical protein